MSLRTTYATLDTLYEPESSFMSLMGCEEQLTDACAPYTFDPMGTWDLPPFDNTQLDRMLSSVPCYTGDMEFFYQTMPPATISMPALSPDAGSSTSATSPSDTSLVNLELSPKNSSNTALISPEMSSIDSASIVVEPKPTQIKDITKPRPRGRPRKYLADSTGADPKTDSLDRYRAKNRRASAKCREREKTQTATLQKTVAEMSYRNDELKRSVAHLREELFDLKMSALKHIDCGCRKIQQYNEWKARDVASAWDLEQSKEDS